MKRLTRVLPFFLLLFVLGRTRAEAATYVVDRLTDANPAGGGEGSGLVGDLRFAITHAQSGDGVSVTVTGTINLTAALPALVRNVTIQGPGANLLTVHGVGGSVLSVGSGRTVAISGLTVTGGSGNGGGIFNQGTLTLNNDTIRDNTAGDQTNGNGTGAGIWNYAGATLTLNGSTVSGNSAIGNLSYAPSRGGGIANYGTLTLNNSTVSGNSAPQGFGGGISNSLSGSVLTVRDSTISANSSPETSGGGGVDNQGTLTAGNSIVAGNNDGDLSGDLASEGHNVFGTTNGGGFDPTDLLDVDPLLGPLQDNGGPTSTMAPQPGSPAIDRTPGAPGGDFPTTDQRAVARPQGALADAGAVEVSPTTSLASWQQADVGAVGLAGGANASAGTYAVDGSGASIFGTSDQFHFVYQTLIGNGQIVARVVSVENTNVNAKAGVMIRENLTGGSRNAMMALKPHAAIGHFQSRVTAGGSSTAPGPFTATAPYWVKLVRSGNTFTGYRSSDGVNWTLAGSVTISMSSTVSIGLAVSAYDNTKLCTATFDNVTVTSSWTDADVGSVGIAGGSGFSAGAYTVDGSGASIFGTSDQFHFTFRSLTGDGQVVARVVSVENTNVNAKAGVMIRENLTGGSRNAMMSLRPYATKVQFQSRVTAGGPSTAPSPFTATAPYWVKLVRSGNTFTGYRSSDGVSWTLAGSATIPMSSTVLIGLAVSAYDNTKLCTATFDNVSVTSSWRDADVGSVGIAGSSGFSAGAHTVDGSGTSIFGTSDQFHFVCQTLIGNGQIVARVVSVENTNVNAKAGVMIRENLTGGSANAMMALRPYAARIQFQSRVAMGGSSTTSTQFTATAPYWVKLVRSGNTFTGYKSPDGITWTLAGSATISMSATASIGLAVSAYDNTKLCTATFDNVTVTLNE